MCIRLHDDYIACDEKKIFNRIAKLFFFQNKRTSEADFEFTFSISRLIFYILMH